MKEKVTNEEEIILKKIKKIIKHITYNLRWRNLKIKTSTYIAEYEYNIEKYCVIRKY